MIRTLLICVTVAAVMSGCGRRFAARCEDPTIYTGSQEIAPVRVPGDLSVPDETEALRIPRPEQLGSAQPPTGQGACLEYPPDFLGNEEASGQAEAQPES